MNDMTVETLCRGHLRSATSGNWRIRLWVKSGQWSVHKLIDPIGWCCANIEDCPSDLLDKLLDAAVPQ